MNDQAKLAALMQPREEMSGAMYDTMFKLVTHGPQEVGDVPSKTGLYSAIDDDWVIHEHHLYYPTDKGIQGFLRAYAQVPNPHHTIFGAIRVGHAEIIGDGQLDGNALEILGAAFDWCKDNVLGSSLVWAKSFSAYDYATFDFTHPETKVTTHLKPGDWIILPEAGQYTVHNLSELN